MNFIRNTNNYVIKAGDEPSLFLTHKKFTGWEEVLDLMLSLDDITVEIVKVSESVLTIPSFSAFATNSVPLNGVYSSN